MESDSKRQQRLPEDPVSHVSCISFVHTLWLLGKLFRPSLVLWHISFFCMDTEIKTDIYLSFSNFIRSVSVLSPQKSSSFRVYIFTNLISTSIHGTRKKQTKKTLARNKRKKYLESLPRGKKKKKMGQKERKGQPRPTPWKKSRDTQSVVKRKPKNPPLILQCYNY